MNNKKKILIIDDEQSLCKLVKANLEFTGKYDVDMAFSGTEGIKKATEQDFDLVLTDFRMPGMNGVDVLTTIKSKKPKAPVVFLSVYHDDSATLTEDIRKRADGLISKPFDNRQLVEYIDKMLEKGA